LIARAKRRPARKRRLRYGASPRRFSREVRSGLLRRVQKGAGAIEQARGFIAKRGRTLSPAAKAFIAIVRGIDEGIPA
jgi:hypothetical protein